MANNTKQYQIILSYAQNWETKICDLLSQYLVQNASKMQEDGILVVINFLNWYIEQLAIFGKDYIDPRIQSGRKEMCRLATSNWLTSKMQAVNEALKMVKPLFRI